MTKRVLSALQQHPAGCSASLVAPQEQDTSSATAGWDRTCGVYAGDCNGRFYKVLVHLSSRSLLHCDAKDTLTLTTLTARVCTGYQCMHAKASQIPSMMVSSHKQSRGCRTAPSLRRVAERQRA